MDLQFASQGQTSVVNCPRAMVGRVIGKGGAWFCASCCPSAISAAPFGMRHPNPAFTQSFRLFAGRAWRNTRVCSGHAITRVRSPLAGETIKALQQYTGASIQIDQSFEPTAVTISGQQSAVSLAQAMVQVSRSPHGCLQRCLPTPCPPRSSPRRGRDVIFKTF